MKTYKDKKYGFEIDLPEEYFVYTGGTPLLPTILYSIAEGFIPRADAAFSTGPNEYINIVIERITPEPPPGFLEQYFRMYAQENRYTDCMFGRIMVSAKEQPWARYQMQGEIWLKKYMIILKGIGYAITASCAGQELFLKREKVWDEIAASLRV